MYNDVLDQRVLVADRMADEPLEVDGQLARGARAGDEAALTRLLRSWGPRVRAQIAPSIQSKWASTIDVDDVMQITYLEAFLRIGQFDYRGEDSFGGWLAQIARNNLRDAIRELERLKRPQPEQRIAAGDGADGSLALLEELGCTTTTPSRHVAREDVRRQLELVLDDLPDDYAAVIRRYDLDGLPVAQVAAELGRSEGAIFMLRARAHDRLRESIGAETQFFSRPR